jgi:autotransporter-associated beta strand protein
LTYASGLSSTNYVFNPAASAVSYVVNPAILNVTISKTYNGDANFSNANTYSIGGTRYNSDAVPTIVSGSAATSSANAATYTSFASSTLALSNTNYTLAGGTVSATIDKAAISVVGTKDYDGTTVFGASRLSAAGVNNEVFGISGTADLSSKNVQTNQRLASVSGLTITPIGNASLSNYRTLLVSNTSVSVTRLAVTLDAPTINKVYDGGYTYSMTQADLNTMSAALVGGDRVTAAEVVFTGNDPNVGSNKPVSLNSVSVSDGNSGGNYLVTLRSSTNLTSVSQITPATLTVAVNTSSKFVTEADPVGYNGVSPIGFVNGETIAVLSGSVSYSRASGNTAGSYELSATGLTANNGNYNIQYVPGKFNIIPADQLLVEITPVDVIYGAAPTYTATARYLKCSVVNCPSTGSTNTIYTLSPIVNGNIFYTSDNAGGAAAFTITPTGATNSSSGNRNVGAYQLEATGVAVTSNNFSNVIALTGALTVKPLSLLATQLGISGVSKVYNGTDSISAVNLNTVATSSSIFSGDRVTVIGTGNYSDANVGNNKSVTISVGLDGLDSGNYYLSTNQITSNIGIITQLASVTYAGGSGLNNNWSDARNWEGGAIPTLSNVAQVVIPVSKTVEYDSANLSLLTPTSTVTNSGSLQFSGTTPVTFANTVSGLGILNVAGVGVVTLTGENTYTGGTSIGSGASLVIGSQGALGDGPINSSGGSLSLVTGITLNSLIVNGPVIVASDIASTGSQVYNDPLTINKPSSNNTFVATLSSTQGDITFNSTINAGGANQSLTVEALLGKVTFGDQVGVAVHTYNARDNAYTPTTYGSYLTQASKNLDYLKVNANSIVIKADITTRTEQEYNGSVLIGDNRDNTRNNGLIRVLLSEDPKITFNGTVNDLLENTHSLYLRAVTIDPSLIPKIELNDEVGGIAPLVKLEAYTGFQDERDEANYSAIIDNSNVQRSDTITIRSNVTTFGDQIYSSNGFVLGNGQSNQLQTFTSFDGNIEFRSGSPSSGGGFVQNNSAGQSLFTAANGQVSGLSGSGLTYQIIDKNSSNLNNVSEIANPAANDAVNWAAILTNEFNRQLGTVEQFKEVTSEEGLVTIDDLILCDPKSDANECLR